jgi:hypothetical protein
VSRESGRGAAGRARDDWGRQLTPAEADAYLATPIADSEQDEVMALVRWFRRRYPTGAERLAYIRRAYRRWTAGARE